MHAPTLKIQKNKSKINSKQVEENNRRRNQQHSKQKYQQKKSAGSLKRLIKLTSLKKKRRYNLLISGMKQSIIYRPCKHQQNKEILQTILRT